MEAEATLLNFDPGSDGFNWHTLNIEAGEAEAKREAMLAFTDALEEICTTSGKLLTCRLVQVNVAAFQGSFGRFDGKLSGDEGGQCSDSLRDVLLDLSRVEVDLLACTLIIDMLG